MRHEALSVELLDSQRVHWLSDSPSTYLDDGFRGEVFWSSKDQSLGQDPRAFFCGDRLFKQSSDIVRVVGQCGIRRAESDVWRF
jgi:hypothetical protein